MAQRVRVEGLRELEAALRELPRATGKGALRRVLKKRAEPIAAEMRAKAPDDPATGGNDLRSSIGVSTKLSRRQATLHRKMFRNDKAAVEMFVGAGPLPQAHLQEFGSSIHGPQPFARPAWDNNKTAILEGLKDDLWAEIKKSADRHARKLARLAAKG